jgi:hypothetical protein
VWNYFNRVNVAAMVQEATGTWTYGSLTWRQTNGSTGNQVSFVSGVAEDPIIADVCNLSQPVTQNTLAFGACGISIDNTTPIGVQTTNSYSQNVNSQFQSGYAAWSGVPVIGGHTLMSLEASPQAANVTFYGAGAGGNPQGLRFRYRM